MTTYERTIEMIESKPGYSYNKQIVEQICAAGYAGIPDGAILGTGGNQQIIKRGNDIVCVNDGVETKRTAGNEQTHNQAVMMYAANMSKIGTKMGSM